VVDSVLFTVFTPTYNRAHTLHRVYDSLCAQTLRDFEWIVVDDGSTDNTAELVAGWVKTATFPIRYFRQNNSGKHIAHNFAANKAQGKFFLPLDSDDACAPSALERMAHHWNAIPERERAQYSGTEGLCSDQHGNLIGDRFPIDPLDATWRERRYVYRIRGEKWGPTLTEIVRQFPFPEVADAQFVPEGTVGLEIAKTYKERCVNEVFRIYYVDDLKTGATLSGRNTLREDAPGRLYYYLWLLNNDLEYFFNSPAPFLKAAVMLPIVARFADHSLPDVLTRLHKASARALVWSVLPLSIVLFAFASAGWSGKAPKFNR
jgi:glycosyltransferase involved in cell wall biosynthesis